MKSKQKRIEDILCPMSNIELEMIDICSDVEHKDRMRRLSNQHDASPPQLFHGDQYCGVCFVGLFLC